jgi:hypothetical protein
MGSENQDNLANINLNLKTDVHKENIHEPFTENIQKLNNSREQYKTNTIQTTIDIDTSNS